MLTPGWLLLDSSSSSKHSKRPEETVRRQSAAKTKPGLTVPANDWPQQSLVWAPNLDENSDHHSYKYLLVIT